jgi:hypothetical protein
MAKQLSGFGSGVLELALAFRGKKSKTGTRRRNPEIDLIHARLRRLKEISQ